VAKLPAISLTRRLPSCKVSRELLGEMERYLRERTAALFEKTESKAVVTVPELAEYPDQLFPDDTTTITLTCNTGQIQDPQITVRFACKKQLSAATILFDDPSLQQAGQDILAGVANIAASHRTRHHLYHSPIVWVLIALLWVGAFAVQWPRLKLHVWDAMIIGFTAAYFGLLPLRPYTVFATRRNQRNEKWAARLRAAALIFVMGMIAYTAVKPLVE
jgi:hypothetical protein